MLKCFIFPKTARYFHRINPAEASHFAFDNTLVISLLHKYVMWV